MPIAAAISSAALLVLAGPPFDLWPLALMALVPLCLVLRQTSPLRAAGLAWLTGVLLYFGACLWWGPLLVRFAQMPSLASIGLAFAVSVYQAVVFALWAGASAFLVRRCHVSWLISGPLCFVLAEAIIPFIFKSYLAITVWRVWPMLQVAELGGPSAVGALLVLANLILAEVTIAVRRRRFPSKPARWAAVVCLLLVSCGWLRAVHIAAVRAEAPRLRVGIVQPNAGILSLEERKRHGRRLIERLREATIELGRRGAELIIWPESAWPYLFDRRQEREYPPGHPWELRPGVGGRLLFGTLTHAFGGLEVYNSAVLVQESGQITGSYDKARLVPFAEYIPFAKAFPAVEYELRVRLPEWPDISAADEPHILVDGDLRLGILICSEDLDMSYVHGIARHGPNILVVLASDAWFSDSVASYQHLALATFRAIETRRDLARATTTGVSAIIDSLGRISVEGPVAPVLQGRLSLATLLEGDVAMMDTFALGPYTIGFFPYASCLLLLMAIFEGRRWRGPTRNRIRRAQAMN